MKKDTTPFFVGYLKPPKKLRSFLMAIGMALAVVLTAAGFVIGGTQDDPGDGAFRFDYGRQTVSGVIEMLPYPILHVTKGSKRVKVGETLMLSAGGKAGVIGRATKLKDKSVQAAGVVLERGTLRMLQLRGGKGGLKADGKGEASPPAAVTLGTWKLAGEICDGKCLAGAMRPGRGLAHKACAALCLIGDVPPVFVSTKPVEGSEFFLILDKDGGPLPKSAYDYIAQFISVEGAVSRHGNLLVLRIDPSSIEVL